MGPALGDERVFRLYDRAKPPEARCDKRSRVPGVRLARPYGRFSLPGWAPVPEQLLAKA